MKPFRIIAVKRFLLRLSFFAGALIVGSSCCAAQESLWTSIHSQNARMAKVQPTWLGPLIQSDARLTQGVKLSYSSFHAPGQQTMSYGNNRGISFIARQRFELDLNPPSFFRNHSVLLKDGWGNASVQLKARLLSGNAEHGNYIVTAALQRTFSGGAMQNGALTGAWIPKLSVGRAWGKFDAQTQVTGVLPTGQVTAQGRVIEWNSVAQFHPSYHVYVNLEDNAAYFKGGGFDGQTQNFLTPVAYVVIRNKQWKPTHPIFAVGGGMQIATSRFHPLDHNLILETRMMF